MKTVQANQKKFIVYMQIYFSKNLFLRGISPKLNKNSDEYIIVLEKTVEQLYIFVSL